MKVMLRLIAVASGLLLASPAWSEVTFYEREEFRGRSFTVVDPVENFAQYGFNDRASSAVVRRGRYLICDDAGFRGRCVTLGPGEYRALRDLGLNNRISSARPAGRAGGGPRAVLFGQANFGGPSMVLEGHDNVRDFAGSGFNDRASSLRVERGHWMLCSRADFRGECRTFGPGHYAHLPPELNNRVSSARWVERQPEPHESTRRREGRDRD
jgi:hypothetical protein